MVDVAYRRMLQRYIPLSELKHYHQEHKAQGAGPLRNLALFTRARLSVQPISQGQQARASYRGYGTHMNIIVHSGLP